MTGKRGDAQPGQGYNFGGEKAVAMDKRLRGFAAQNALRVNCSICGNLVMPDKLDQHNRAFHS